MKLSEVTNPQSGGRMRLSEVQASIDGKPVKATIEKKPSLTKAFMFGGVPGVGMTPGSEDLLPAVGQTMGGTVAGYPGSVFGAASGQAARQGVKALRGEEVENPISSEFAKFGPMGIRGPIAEEAAMTGSIEGIFRGAGKAAKPLANRLMIGAIRPAKDVVRRTPNFGLEAADSGLFGSLKTIKKKAISNIEALSPRVEEILKGNKGRVDVLKIALQLDDLKNPYDDVLNKAIESTQNSLIRNADDLGKISSEAANREKQFLYKALKDSQWGKGVGEVPAKATVRKNATFGLRKSIEEVAPEVGPMNRKIGTSVGALEGVSKQQEKLWYKPLIPFFETVGGVGGLATGNPWLTAAILARRAAQSPLVLSRGAQALLSSKLGSGARLAASEGARRASGR